MPISIGLSIGDFACSSAVAAAVPELAGVEHRIEDRWRVAASGLIVNADRGALLVGKAERVVVASLAMLEVVGGEPLLDEQRLAERNFGGSL